VTEAEQTVRQDDRRVQPGAGQGCRLKKQAGGSAGAISPPHPRANGEGWKNARSAGLLTRARFGRGEQLPCR
jgi:hypothetical protein